MLILFPFFSLATVSGEVAEQRKGIEQVGERVAATEHRVEKVTDDVTQMDSTVGQLRGDVSEQASRIQHVAADVTETKGKVEEIDKKVRSTETIKTMLSSLTEALCTPSYFSLTDAEPRPRLVARRRQPDEPGSRVRLALPRTASRLQQR